MSILQQENTESISGFKKEIDEGGISLLLDTVQIYMYQFPARSSIRECVSNAIDSITEKNIAKKILRKEANVSDFYVEKDGEIYKDSKFDPEYYDLNYLSDDDTVYIKYKEGDGIAVKDQVIIKDNGVGLGGQRLEGFFKLAYSSKRLNTKVLGAFGLGAKAPLATGVDFFSLKTAHNGKEFSFIIYKDKVDSAYTKWNTDGSKNDYITFSNGFKVYYKNTRSTNFVELSWDVKRHQKQQYVDAVKSQLLYFKNPIKFEIQTDWGSEKVDFQAKILYETDDFIIAEQKYYSRPHLIVNGVCYGFIQFEELEIDQKYGSVGLKVSMEDITVTPSRESCVWNTKTKDTILSKYNSLSRGAETYINNYLSNLNILEWISTCNAMSGGRLYNTSNELKIITNLASLAGFSSLKLKYKNTKYQFKSSLPDLIDSTSLEMCYVTLENYWSSKLRQNKTRIKYNITGNLSNFDSSKKYIQIGASSPIRSSFILNEESSYITVRPHSRSTDDFKDLVSDLLLNKVTLEDTLEKINTLPSVEIFDKDEEKKRRITMYKNAIEFLNLLSEEGLTLYENVAIPLDYKSDVDTEGETNITPIEDVKTPKEKVDFSKLRKAAGKVLIQYPRIEYNGSYVLSKIEMKLTDLDDCTDTIVYGTKEDLPLLNFLYTISRDYNSFDGDSKTFTDKVRVCVIAKSIVKYFTSFTHVKDYLFGKNEDKLCDELVRYYTANMVGSLLPDRIKYLKKFSEFSKSLTSEYELLYDYVRNYSKPYNFNTSRNPLDKKAKDFMDNCLSVQTKLLNDGIEKATEFSVEKYGDEKYVSIEVFDKNILDKLDWIIDFDKVFGTLFSEISSFKEYSKMSPELAMEIKEIIEIKRESLTQDYPDLCC